MKHIIIDGYNLMHALGLMTARMTPAALAGARTRLLDLLAEKTAGRDVQLAVVFDAAGAPKKVPAEEEYRGIMIHAAKHEEADDLIEAMVQRQVRRQELAVVSNDRRLIKTAERRGCVSLRCEAFMDWLLESPPRLRTDAAESAGRTPAEREHWLREFGHLDHDPELGRPLEFPE